MGIGSVLTGLAIYKPVQFHTLCSLLGGYEWARAEHFILTILFTLFFVVHIVQVILAGWNNFRSMVTGLDVLRLGKNSLQPVVVNIESESDKLIPAVNKLPGENKKPDKKIAMNDNIEKVVVPDEKNLPAEPEEEETGTTHNVPSDDNTNTEERDTDKITGK